MTIKRKIQLALAGLLLASGLAFAGLETVTHIQDLNASWPLGSDLASTSDDHLRNIKSALKTDFPNMNGTVNSAAAPIFGIPGDADTGLYESAANDVALSAGGTKALDCTSTVCSLVSANVTGATVPANGIYSPSANALSFSSNSLLRGTISSGGAWNIPTPTSGVAFTSNGVAGSYAAQANGSSTSGQSNGQLIVAGTTSADIALLINNQANTQNYFQVRGDGAITGRGTTAAALVDMAPDKGTFTATLVGGATSPTGTATWAKNGNIVVLTLPTLTATSNATSFSYSGLPAAIQPAVTTQNATIFAINNTAIVLTWAQVANGSSSVVFSVNAVGGFNTTNWTASGTKGLAAVTTISYALN